MSASIVTLPETIKPHKALRKSAGRAVAPVASDSTAVGLPAPGIAPLGSTTSIASTGAEKARERRYKLLQQAKQLLPATARVQVCMHVKASAFGVRVMVDRTAGKGYVEGAMCCGDLWACPVCSEKITGYRRDELRGAVERWQAAGNTVAMMTMGAAHHADTDLRWFVDSLLKACRQFKGGREMQTIRQEYQWRGDVRALEDTYNVNGHNPHNHYLIFFEGERSPAAIAGLETQLRKRWQRVCKKQGLYASAEYGLKLTVAQEAISGYVAKQGAQESRTWGAADEMTRHQHKRGSKGLDGIQKGFTAWELLDASTWAKDDYRFIGEARLLRSPVRAGKLFRQYYEAFTRRNQLVYSRGLRDLLGLGDEQTDEALAEQQDGEDFVCALALERGAYNAVNRAGKLATVLQWSIEDRMADVRALLRSLGIQHFDLMQFDMRSTGPPKG